MVAARRAVCGQSVAHARAALEDRLPARARTAREFSAWHRPQRLASASALGIGRVGVLGRRQLLDVGRRLGGLILNRLSELLVLLERLHRRRGHLFGRWLRVVEEGRARDDGDRDAQLWRERRRDEEHLEDHRQHHRHRVGEDADDVVGKLEDGRDGEAVERIVGHQQPHGRGVSTKEPLGCQVLTIFDEEADGVEEHAPRVEQHVLQVDRVERAVLFEKHLRIDACER
mmetsp:Transcript_21397/g.54727  ORF Transcript_21397/g.54727 Transcript_21397/m.54727 type:complete len:229 (+) Transcript_21397:238-924(+)